MRPYTIVLLVCCSGLAWGQSSPESSYKQVRLDDIERENLKSTQQAHSQPGSSSPLAAQYQSSPVYHYQPQYYSAQAQQSPSLAMHGAQAQLFAQPQLSPSQLSGYHQQLLFSQQQPVYIPQHQPLPFPIMLIPSPYLLPQDINSIFQLQGQPQAFPQSKYRPATVQQIPSSQGKPFRPSPQIGYSAQYQPQSPQYNAYQSLYQQKYATGVKSTVSPPLKDNYVQQASTYGNYKLQ